ncbi:hypothetical protein BLOT_006127 [Blomia tropicalis]|nr:hypothetical protein BLOT_006127 [Blomia tropicalis]
METTNDLHKVTSFSAAIDAQLIGLFEEETELGKMKSSPIRKSIDASNTSLNKNDDKINETMEI